MFLGVKQMKNKHIYTTKNGLKVLYVYKPEFYKSYVGIGVNYGNRDLEFVLHGKKYVTPSGTAHFIEHKLFQLPDKDAFAEFAKLNVTANAYTSNEKTIYYFTTTSKIDAPLKVLLEMYWTPYFTKEDVEKEKDIILSELSMYEDIPDAKFSQKILDTLYPKSFLAQPVAGTKESVQNIQVEDLFTAYQAFYTTDNSYLVIVSNQKREEVLALVEETMATFKVHRGLQPNKRESFQELKKKNLTVLADVEQTTASLAIRMEADETMPLFCNYIIGILDSILSPMSEFYNELYKKKAFIADIEYYVVTLRDASYAVISTISKTPQVFLKEVRKKLSHLKPSDLNLDILNLYLKHMKAKSILEQDSVETLGEEILTLALEGISYYEEVERSLSMHIEDYYEYLSYITQGKMLTAICKNSKN